MDGDRKASWVLKKILQNAGNQVLYFVFNANHFPALRPAPISLGKEL
jgi:hypothetical protein